MLQLINAIYVSKEFGGYVKLNKVNEVCLRQNSVDISMHNGVEYILFP